MQLLGEPEVNGSVTNDDGLTATRSYGLNRLEMVIDLGNGDVKALVRQGNQPDARKVCFPSLVAVEAGNRLVINGVPHVIGPDSLEYVYKRTGAEDVGKISNALPLLVGAIDRAVGFTRDYTVNLIFTCPSVKHYGGPIKEQLVGTHKIDVLGEEVLGEEPESFTLTVDKVSAQLEGHMAYQLVKEENYGKRRTILVDVGSRTLIVTVIGMDGRILHRKSIPQAGVYTMLYRLREHDALAGLPGLSPEADEEIIRRYLFDLNPRDSHYDDAVERSRASVMSCIAQANEYISQQIQEGDRVYLLGGGAMLPGLKGLVHGKPKLMRDPQWATVSGLSLQASKLLARA